ncbi:D-erythro-7,8-dihydroneopterin triphosphate epimerase [Marinilabilia salmonicolor]|uniref:Dihydroneopterin triphosphate 2'-epimerase n=2 Tax=Marinilabilia salmonicolor TaxID=989 RepID=A0A2T0XFS8_9BACT|nr:D-erythro-7,8-dihydroneopterin triphosphate epimerase [Marinilabilia salmonicolor]RCW32471.1 D-erythro-7,8-dihydroneopterin triphosphate epimerase [Marinilabilia salmonicolor]
MDLTFCNIMATIFIKDLLLRTEVGFNPHELGKKQDLLLNISIQYQINGEEINDNPEAALNYRDICKRIIDLVENRKFNLLEKVANEVAHLILDISRVEEVSVEVDKPHALRFAKSVSFSLTKNKSEL